MERKYEESLALDAEDQLSGFRNRFVIDGHTPIYLDGNSLGMLPKATGKHMKEVIEEQWGSRLIRSWNERWYSLALHLGDKLAPLIGANPGEVIFSDSTSVNLYKLAHGAVSLQSGRKKIVTDTQNFPTDVYILQGIADSLGEGRYVELAESPDGITVPLETLEKTVDSDTSLVVLSQVAFKSGFLYDMKEVTQLAHDKGALILWDLSHSAGVFPIDLQGAGADLAVGCSYKYLNGGPGAPAFLYAAESIQQLLPSPIWGWFGDKHPFAFSLSYTPADTIKKFLAGTPPVLSLSAIEPALDLLIEAGIDQVREKSVSQTEYLIGLAEARLPEGIIGTPREAKKRGSHVSFRHPEAYRICRALIDPLGKQIPVIPDFREPDIIRLGISPLYTTYRDIAAAVRRIEHILSQKEYELYSSRRTDVT